MTEYFVFPNMFANKTIQKFLSLVSAHLTLRQYRINMFNNYIRMFK
jgi:hypothetical protein